MGISVETRRVIERGATELAEEAKNGLFEVVQGSPAVPYDPTEVEAIEDIFLTTFLREYLKG